MLKGAVVATCLSFSLAYGGNLAPYTSLDTKHKKEGMRIFNLLPGLNEMTPLVEPALPADFICLEKKNSKGSTTYYWGREKDIIAYQQDSAGLTGMLLKVEVPANAYQEGHDRFSMDGRYERWMASGFSQIVAKKGRWGMFPTREIKMKGPKKREHYKLWVGLNSETRRVLMVELIYPKYLKAPADSYKRVWNTFVTKTSLLKPGDLMLAYGQGIYKGYTDIKGQSEVVRFKVHKRRKDSRLLVEVLTSSNPDIVMDVRQVTDHATPHVDLFSPGFVTFDVCLAEAGKHKYFDKVKVYYEHCDLFPFTVDFLSLGRFLKNPHPQVVIFQN